MVRIRISTLAFAVMLAVAGGAVAETTYTLVSGSLTRDDTDGVAALRARPGRDGDAVGGPATR